MIQYESERIGSIDAKSISEHTQQLKKELEEKAIDLICDCSEFDLDVPLLDEIHELQKNKNKCIVIILPAEKQEEYSANWNLVPSLQEALDFISFEQMQRDLGF